MNLAILLVDLYEGVDETNPDIHYEYGSVADGLDTIEEILKLGKDRNIPMFASEPTFVDYGRLKCHLSPRFKSYFNKDQIIQSKGGCIFAWTDLDEKLKNLDIIHLLIMGFDRDDCWRQTIVGAHWGYKVVASERLTLTRIGKSEDIRNGTLRQVQGISDYKETVEEVIQYIQEFGK